MLKILIRCVNVDVIRSVDMAFLGGKKM